jgi:hypothetical protein
MSMPFPSFVSCLIAFFSTLFHSLSKTLRLP